MEKHSVSRLSDLFAHLHLLSSYSFSSTLLSSNLSLLSASSLLCFSSVHIVGSLTSKLPSNILTSIAYPIKHINLKGEVSSQSPAWKYSHLVDPYMSASRKPEKPCRVRWNSNVCVHIDPPSLLLVNITCFSSAEMSWLSLVWPQFWWQIQC